MCPFSQGRAHFGKISALELNGQHTGRTNHRHLYSAHPILQIGSKRMGCGVKVNGVRECWESCQTLTADMHQAPGRVSSRDRSPNIQHCQAAWEWQSISKSRRHDSPSSEIASYFISLSMVSSGFASLFPQFPVFMQSKSFSIFPFPNSCVRMCPLRDEGRGAQL